MRILLTGATGFIGSHLARHLGGIHEVGILLRPGSKKERLPSNLPQKLQLNWDGKSSSLPGLIAGFRPDVIIHLVGYIINPHRPEDVERLIDSNIRFGTVLLDAAVTAGCKQFISTGSYAQHFANADYAPFGLYGATKQAFADILTYYAEAGGLTKTLTLDLTHVYGEGSQDLGIISVLSRAAASGETLAMSPGEQWLDFVHVRDVVTAYEQSLDVLQQIADGEQRVYAVRSGHPLQLKDFVALFNEISAQPVRIAWGSRPYRARETMQPWTQGEILPGWQPRVDLRDGLREFLKA